MGTSLQDNQEAHSKNGSTVQKITALTEVVIVRFVIYALLAAGMIRLLYGTPSPDPIPIEAPYLIGALWFLIPGILIFGFRRNAREYGLTAEHGAQSVSLVLDAFLFFVLTNLGFVILVFMNWSYLEPAGALVMTAFFSLALWLITRVVAKRYDDFEATAIPVEKHRNNLLVLTVLLLLPIMIGLLMGRFSWLLVSTIVWQFFFSGFGEEFFFRGYIQSRLNLAFGRPYEWRGIRFGAGLFLTAGIFALTHMLNTANIWLGDFNLAWWWGSFTFVGGLLFGLLREKTGSIVAPGVLHGLEAVGEGLGLLFF